MPPDKKTNNNSEFKTKLNFNHYSELSSSELKDYVSNFKNIPLKDLKEVLFILSDRENYKVEQLDLLSEIISHFNLTRSGELKPSQEEIKGYKIVDIKSSHNKKDIGKTDIINNLKMQHGGNLISIAGRNLFISHLLIISLIIVNIIFFLYRSKNPDQNLIDEINTLFFISGITLIVSLILQMTGFAYIHNAGKIFKSND